MYKRRAYKVSFSSTVTGEREKDEGLKHNTKSEGLTKMKISGKIAPKGILGKLDIEYNQPGIWFQMKGTFTTNE